MTKRRWPWPLWVGKNRKGAVMSVMHQRWLHRLAKNPCTACDLHKTRHSLVIYRGNPQAKVLCLGEAPGYWEDQKGIPFVGRAGQLLNQLLMETGFDPQKDVYICNTIKCRPPDNRTPTPEELSSCRPLLEAQLRLVRPKVIVALGLTAVRSLGVGDPKGTMGSMVGKWYEYNGCRVIVVYHPAYLLRRPADMETEKMWLDEVRAVLG